MPVGVSASHSHIRIAECASVWKATHRAPIKPLETLNLARTWEGYLVYEPYCYMHFASSKCLRAHMQTIPKRIIMKDIATETMHL